MKKVLAILLILVIIAVVITTVGAGVMVLFENQRILGLPVYWGKYNPAKVNGPLETTITHRDLDDRLYSKDTAFEIKSGSFDINLHYLDLTKPENSGTYYKEDIYITVNANIMGFTKAEKFEVDCDVIGDVDNNKILITTTQPGDTWYFTNDCVLDVYIPRETIGNVTIKTDGKVTVGEGFHITNLTITSNNKQANNAIVNCLVGTFTLNNENGSGSYDTFRGNLVLNSKYGSFTFNEIRGNVTITGVSVDVNINKITNLGSLTYNVEYGRGTFGVISGNATINSKSTNLHIKQLDGRLVVDGGDSIIKIDANGLSPNDENNVITMNGGVFELKHTQHTTIVNALKGDIKILYPENVVKINPDLKDISKSKANVYFEGNSEIDASRDSLTVKTNGKIDLRDLTGEVNVISGDNDNIYLEFKKVNANSIIDTTRGEIKIKVPNDQNFKVEACSSKQDYVDFSVGGTTTPNEIDPPNADGELTKFTYIVGNDNNPSNTITIKTIETIKVSSIQAN